MLGLVFLLIFAIGIALTIVFSVRNSVARMLRSPDAHENPDAAESLVASLPVTFKILLDSEGFRFTKAYSFQTATFGIWMQISPHVPSRYFCLLRVREHRVFNFETVFSDDMRLTTTMTNTAFLYPRIFGHFQQSFPRAKPDTLWNAHLKGEEFIVSTFRIPITESGLSFLERFRREVLQMLTYVTSLKLWYIRAIYWYLIRRFLLQNQPIWKQDISKLYGQRVT